jgi:hypothetical protein
MFLPLPAFSPQQDYSARRRQEFEYPGAVGSTPPRYDAGYECEPPPDVRAELGRPRRAQILKQPSDRPAPDPQALMLRFVVLAVIAGGIANWLHPAGASRALAIHVEPSPVPPPEPTPEPAPHSNWESDTPSHSAPRAPLMKLPPPRAQLVRGLKYRHL